MTRILRAIPLKLKLAGLALLVPLLALGWYLGSPLFIDKTVDEDFPAAVASGQQRPAAPASSPEPAMPEEDGPAPTREPESGGIRDTAGMSPHKAKRVRQEPPASEMKAPGAKAGNETVKPKPTPVSVRAAGPVVLTSGRFGNIDSVHKGEGTATVYRLPNGRRVLRFEGFRVTNGPDLYVYLSGDPAPRDGEGLHRQGALEVARLKGNVGNQNYVVPPEVDPTGWTSVVVWCDRFNVSFGAADLSPGGGN